LGTRIGVGLVECGSIGTVIARAIDEGRAEGLELIIVYDIVREHAERLVSRLRSPHHS